MPYVYRFLLPLRLGWLLVYCQYKEVNSQINVCPFDYTDVAGSGKDGPLKVNHTSWVAVVNQNDRPKLVRNRFVIDFFCVALFVLSLCPFDISAGVGAFVIGLSQISSFFS